MLKLLSRIIKISGKYKSRIQIAFIFAFLKSMLSKAPLCIAFLVFMEFYNQTMTVEKCWLYGLALLISVLLETLCQYIFRSSAECFRLLHFFRYAHSFRKSS